MLDGDLSGAVACYFEKKVCKVHRYRLREILRLCYNIMSDFEQYSGGGYERTVQNSHIK